MIVRPFCVLVVGLACHTAESVAKETWLYAKSDHFEMYSSASEKDSRETLARLEQFRAFFLTTVPKQNVTRELHPVIFLFGSDRTFRPYKPLYDGKPKDVSGYFVAFDDEVVMALTADLGPDAADDDDPCKVVMHEYVHLMLHERGINPPLWLNEGMAEVYSSFKVFDNDVEIGAAPSLYVDYLQNVPFVPLAKLFAVTPTSKAYNDEEQAGMFYAESWLVAHYLLCGPDKGSGAKLNRFEQLTALSPHTMEANFSRRSE